MIRDKKIISEISRIKEVMGVTQNLITETSDPILNLLNLDQRAKKWGNDFANWIRSSGRKVTDRNGKITINGIEVSSQFANRLEAALMNADTFWETMARDINDLKMLGNLIQSDESLATKFYDDIMDDLINSGNETLKGKSKDEMSELFAIAIYRKMKDEGKDLDTVLQEIYTIPTSQGNNEYWELIIGLRNKTQKAIDSLPEATKKAIDTPGKTTFTGWQQLAKVWTFQAEFIKNLFLDSDKIRKEIENLVNDINAKINNAKLNPGETELDINSDLDMLLNKVISLKKTGAQITAAEFEKYLLNNKLLENNKLYQQWLDGYKYLDDNGKEVVVKGARNEIEALMRNSIAGWAAAFGETTIVIAKSILEYIPFVKFKQIGQIGGPGGLQFDGLGPNFANTVKRWTNTLVRRTPLNIEELRRLRAMQGRNGYALDKLLHFMAIYPLGVAIWEVVTNAYKNQGNIDAYNKLSLLYKELCGGQTELDEEGKQITITKTGAETDDCNKIKNALENLFPEKFQFDYLNLVLQGVRNEFTGPNTMGALFDGDWAQLVVDGTFMTDLDNFVVWLWNEIRAAGETFHALTPEQIKRMLTEFYKENNPELGKILNELNIEDPDFMDEAIKRIQESSPSDFITSREPYKDVIDKHPKLTEWVDVGLTTWRFENDDTRFKLIRYSDRKEFKAQKFNDGWKWVFPTEISNKPLGDGSDPTKVQTQNQTGNQTSTPQPQTTTELTDSDAERIVFDKNEVLAKYRQSDTNAKIYLVNDNQLLVLYNGNNYEVNKFGYDDWRYLNGGAQLYPPRQQTQNTGGNTEVETNTGGGGNTGGGSGLDKNSYINRKNLINQVNPKTLKESIRNKVLLKHEDKKLKIKKINENLRKFEEQFYYENYNKFFNKMFKLAESYKKSKLYLTEDDDMAFDEALLKSGLFRGQEDRMKKEFCNYVCAKLKLDGELRDKFEEKIKDYPFENIGQLFTDSEKVADMIYKSFIETLPSQGEEPTDFMTAIKSVIRPHLKTADFERNFKSTLTDLSNPVMDKARKKVDVLVDKIKELLAKEDSES